MDCSVKECEAMIAAQKKTGPKLIIAYRLHCDPGNMKVLERVRKGDFGDPRVFTSMHTHYLLPDNHRAKNGKNRAKVDHPTTNMCLEEEDGKSKWKTETKNSSNHNRLVTTALIETKHVWGS